MLYISYYSYDMKVRQKGYADANWQAYHSRISVLQKFLKKEYDSFTNVSHLYEFFNFYPGSL